MSLNKETRNAAKEEGRGVAENRLRYFDFAEI